MSVVVHINKQIGGYTISIPPLTKVNLQKQYPKATPISSIFISADIGKDLSFYYSSIKKYLLPFLLGLDKKTLKSIKIKLIDSSTNKKIEV